VRVRWFGQSAFLLTGEAQRVMIDPFGDTSALRSRVKFDYPPIAGVSADLVLVTHDHVDHNGVEVIEGDPEVLRATAGTFESPVGEVTGIASEHDSQAGTARGENTIYVFTLDGMRICHLGDLGQAELRAEQRTAIGEVDLMFIPIGGGPTIGAAEAGQIVQQLAPAVVVPMHYRTPSVDFLEPPDEFLEAFAAERVRRVPESEFEPPQDGNGRHSAPTVVALTAPLAG
jgi:L-ascorbate metabolism protein UlaG (beta-lactamase superfamily)